MHFLQNPHSYALSAQQHTGLYATSVGLFNHTFWHHLSGAGGLEGSYWARKSSATSKQSRNVAFSWALASSCFSNSINSS